MFPLTDIEDRDRVERAYLYLQIYHRLHCVWWNWILPGGATFSLSATVVLAMYVGLRHTELPWYLYWIFWLAGAGLLLQIFGQGHDIVFAKEDSEEVVEKLQSPASASADLRSVSDLERKIIHKRSKALTPLQFGIASFTNFSWGVTLGAWDEILNQLFFLLSL